jgi:hypothetical protein
MNPIIIQPFKKLGDDESYNRPEKTITESIQTKKDIEDQLSNFEEISNDDLCYVNTGTQLKYLSYDKKNKKELFRFGGLLIKVNKEYLVLAGKEGLRFSAQRYTKNDKNEIIHTTRFFKKIKETEILKNQLLDTMEQTNDIIQQKDDIIEKQKKELIALKKKYASKK